MREVWFTERAGVYNVWVEGLGWRSKPLLYDFFTDKEKATSIAGDLDSILNSEPKTIWKNY